MESKQHLNSPKDFFIWLGIMVSLYVSVFSVILLLFELINYAFPDNLNSYTDPSGGGLRAAMAVLAVSFPLYVYLTRKNNQNIRKSPQEKEHLFRKWIIYLTLFASSATLAIDLAVLINAFLGGDLTSRFLLKSLSIFIVVGFLFYYYLSDLKGKWREDKKLSERLGQLAGFLVFAILVLGFLTVGSPSKQRALRFDNQRINDLQSITWEIDNYYRENERLPENLSDARDDSYAQEIFTDPESGESYLYRALDEDKYELCAKFNLESGDFGSRSYYQYDWDHSAGESCFERGISSEILKPAIVR